MAKSVYLVALVLLAALVFAPAAMAQQMEDEMMEETMMMEDEMMSNASASSLPGTGGTPVLPLISAVALVLIVGSGMLAATVVRRNS
jgi:hypothetical protein